MRQRIFTARSKRRAASWAALGCGLLAALLAAPAAADPAAPSVPDAGARPAANGPLQIPGAAPGANPAQNPETILGPLAREIRTMRATVQGLGEQLKQVEADVTRLESDAAEKERAWENASEALERARERAESAAAEAYKSAVALGPFGQHAYDIHQLSKYTPVIGVRPGSGQSPARELARAEEAERAAGTVHQAAQQALQSTTLRRDTLRLSYQQADAQLIALRTNNAAQLAQAEAEENAYEGAVGGGRFPPALVVDGMTENPLVERVLQHARSKLGLPYLWGAEGPTRYDCSGLTWDSYRQVNFVLPRVANNQFNATRQVPVSKLLRGDLLFFGPPGPWVGIHHVGIYIGNGQMIHSPTSGDVVKISTVWWSRFYGATRPLREVPAPRPNPSTNPPSATPSGSQSASPDPSANPSPSGSSSSGPPPSSEPPPSSNPPLPASSPPASDSPDPGSSGSPAPS